MAREDEADVFPRNIMEFLDRFGTDAACLEYVRAVRWPDGCKCPSCGTAVDWETARGTLYCRVCDRQTSVTAGTILHNSRTPIRKWFMGVWLLCTQKTGVSARTIQRELKVGYKTAWLMLQKLRGAMVRADRGSVSKEAEVDETYIGGEESGVSGRQLVGKALVAIAVELDGKKVGRIRLRHVPDASGQSLVGFVADCVEPGASRCRRHRVCAPCHPHSWRCRTRIEVLPPCSPRRLVAQTLAGCHPPGRCSETASPRVSRRIRLPLQSPPRPPRGQDLPSAH